MWTTRDVADAGRGRTPPMPLAGVAHSAGANVRRDGTRSRPARATALVDAVQGGAGAAGTVE